MILPDRISRDEYYPVAAGNKALAAGMAGFCNSLHGSDMLGSHAWSLPSGPYGINGDGSAGDCG